MKKEVRIWFGVAAIFFLIWWLKPVTVPEKQEDSNRFESVKQKERDFSEVWCSAHEGVMEFMLPDRSRCDCLTETHAVEVDFAAKWKEAVGQSLHYAGLTKKAPGIVLILKSEKDEKYLLGLKRVISEFNLPIKVWTTSELVVSEEFYLTKVS